MKKMLYLVAVLASSLSAQWQCEICPLTGICELEEGPGGIFVDHSADTLIDFVHYREGKAKPQAISCIISHNMKFGRVICFKDVSGKNILSAQYKGTCLFHEKTRAVFEKYVDLSTLKLIKDETKSYKKIK